MNGEFVCAKACQLQAPCPWTVGTSRGGGVPEARLLVAGGWLLPHSDLKEGPQSHGWVSGCRGNPTFLTSARQGGHLAPGVPSPSKRCAAAGDDRGWAPGRAHTTQATSGRGLRPRPCSHSLAWRLERTANRETASLGRSSAGRPRQRVDRQWNERWPLRGCRRPAVLLVSSARPGRRELLLPPCALRSLPLQRQHLLDLRISQHRRTVAVWRRRDPRRPGGEAPQPGGDAGGGGAA